MSEFLTSARQLPLAHLSIRVPWHDAAWEGTVCRKPGANIACLILKRIRQARDDDLEASVSGTRWDQLPVESLPACVAERGSIMAPFEFTRVVNHPYLKYKSPLYEHFAPTSLRHPPYSAACVPFRWMRRDFVAGGKGSTGIADVMLIDYEPEREPTKEQLGFDTGWIQHHQNQRVMLDTFFSAIQPEYSLCIFYAKRTPLSDDPKRVIVGVGRVRHVGQPVEYERSSGAEWRSYLWDCPVQHSIRPGYKDGFLLPYQQLLEEAERNPSINPEEYVAFAPEGYWDAFSYGSEHVSHDGAIGALLACERVLRKMGEIIPGDWDTPLQWISDQLGILWAMRGPYPGLGSALTAFGINRGNLVAYELALQQQNGHREWNEDPWPLVDAALNDPSMLPTMGQYLSGTHRDVWNNLNSERRGLLKMLSRFELTVEQATRFYNERQKAGIEATETDLLANPYLLYELDRLRMDPISIGVIDRGLFPDPIVRSKHPLPEPSTLDGELDPRRVRALAVHQLELSAAQGHSLQPRDTLIQAIRDMELDPACPASIDVMGIVEPRFLPMISIETMKDGETAYQLERLHQMRDVIRNTVEKRMRGKSLTGNYDWRKLLDEALPAKESSLDQEQEEQARQEKAAALEILYSSRISVLAGPAGTGKTTLLRVLCSLPGIKGQVLLLAPTGKARVRMETEIGVTGAKTIAQFLFPDRYDGETGRYHLAPGNKRGNHNTVIIDEASMLTEEQLAAVIDAIEPPERLILVGDPRQLPPIGTGRPFLDIVRRLTPPNIEAVFPRIGPSYAELTIRRRQTGTDRPDLMLAEWFSGRSPGAGADEIWCRLDDNVNSDCLRLVQWHNDAELYDCFVQVLIEELGLKGKDDNLGFEISVGGSDCKGTAYFNLGHTADRVEAWQILSPVHGEAHGVTALNRLLQDSFRHRTRQSATVSGWGRKIPKPKGTEGILYGDKVINVINRRRKQVYSPKKDALEYVANGEIGVVIGDHRFGKRKKVKGLPSYLEVEFSSQPWAAYKYLDWDFSEESNPSLELAYALTVHKTQGSEFGITFVILPNPCRLLSRELLYTAFTRQKNKLVILYQGDFGDLFRYSADDTSEIARRLTNLFEAPSPVPVQVDNQTRYLEANLIHRTRQGDRVRSKSEVIIADLLFGKGIPYSYERRLIGIDGSSRLPDFTIDDAESGLRVYWEHLGMLQDPAYQQRWERKLEWYRGQGIVEDAYGGGPNGILIVTRDDEHGGIDSAAIEAIVQRVFGI